MLWWTGSTGPAEIFILALCGAVGSYGWFHAMSFCFRRAGLLPPEGDDATEVRPGNFHAWLVWTGAMMVTAILTMWLLDLVNPFIPAGDWHQPLKSIFVIFVWPGLMWSLRPMIRRRLPAASQRAPRPKRAAP